VMKEGRVQAFGPKDAVLGQVLQRPGPHAAPIKVVSDTVARRQ
jgi:ATP-binding cassette subfamily C protein